MQPGREKETASKEKISEPIGYEWCAYCDRVIPIFNHTRHKGTCPMCRRTFIIVGKNTGKEWFGKHE